MSKEATDSVLEILERLLKYIYRDEGLDLMFLNVELENLSESLDRIEINKLEAKEIGLLLHGLMIIEAELKKMGLVSHIVKNMRESIYDKSI